MNSSIGPKLPLTLDKKNGILSIDNYVDEIKQNLKILCLTAPGERVFLPEFGVGLRNYLFQNSTPDLFSTISERISDQVQTYLPYININNINIFESPDIDNTMYVVLDYFITPLNFNDQLTLSFIE
jgi:phage baseplate assembly protein W